MGLLATVVLLFGFQAEKIIGQPQTIVLIAIPLLIQTYGIFAIAYSAAKALKLPHNIAAPACMISTSNFFELAVAVAKILLSELSVVILVFQQTTYLDDFLEELPVPILHSINPIPSGLLHNSYLCLRHTTNHIQCSLHSN